VSRNLIADDQALLRASLKALINGYDGCEVVGEASNGVEAVAMAASLAPDLILMDVRMPELDGIEATHRITAAQPDVKILILTTFDLDEYVYDGLLAGASGFLLKDSPPADLVKAITVITAGEALLTPAATRRLIGEFVRHRGVSAPAPAVDDSSLDALTSREREVLELVARGMSNNEIAKDLYVTLSTVKTHVSSLLAKLDARDRAQLVIRAYENGVVRAG
jgi:DNA-binding NarL/FixJ family response regulator